MSVRQGNVIIAGGNAVTVDQTLDINSPNAIANSAVTAGLNGKEPTITGAATTITTNNLAAARAVITDANGKIDASTVTSTELGYMHGVTSAVQTQINAKANDNAVVHLAGTETITGDKTFSGSVALGSSATATPTHYSNNSNLLATTSMVHDLNNTQRTNCITNIPQDIKLELNNGTLTLKAGSKVYVPNGAGVFDTVTIANDISFNMTWGGNTKRLLFVKNNGTALEEREFSFSGGTAPTSEQYSLWYDTTNNAIKYTSNSGSTWSSNCSFPIALIANTNNVTTSIDQVFNGFGYIGSTIFALPGVEVLRPNGRNADGTLNSYPVTIDNVRTFTNGNYTYENAIMVLGIRDINIIGAPSWYYYERSNTSYYNYCYFGRVSATNGSVYNFNTKTSFHAVDYNDLTVGGLGFQPGMVVPYAGSITPDGWLVCDGSAISRTKYASLFAAIGTTYGTGDGSTTFNLPNLLATVPMFRTDVPIGTLDNGSLPNITGTLNWQGVQSPSTTGAFSYTTGATAGVGSGYTQYFMYADFNASRSSSAYSRNDNWVIPRHLVMSYIIKY